MTYIQKQHFFYPLSKKCEIDWYLSHFWQNRGTDEPHSMRQLKPIIKGSILRFRGQYTVFLGRHQMTEKRNLQ